MQNPLVSVIISSYNQREFIEDAIMSVLTQTYQNIEIIVIDDASTDDSQQIVKQILSSSLEKGRMRLIQKENNEGVTYSRNIGLLEAVGDYICFLDGDDLYLPEKIATQVGFMEKHQGLAISYHDADVFDSISGKSLFLYSGRFGAGNGTAHDLISKGMYCHFGSLMFRRESVVSHHFDTQVRIVDDWLFTVDVLMPGNQDVFYIDEVLSKYRRHSTNITLNWEDKTYQNLKALNIMESRYKTAKFSIRARKAELYFILTVFSFMKRDLPSALRGVFNYLKYSIPNPFRFMRILRREMKFFSANDYQFDILTKSLWETDF